MTKDQVREAITQMRTSCELAMATYEPLSARGVLNALGFGADAEEILQAIYDGGFTNCLDPQFPTTFYDGKGMTTEYPSADVCYWGPDQLESRLACIHIY